MQLTSNPPLHIAIIGAGLGGLCLAQGLKKHGISVAVYEKDGSAFSRNQGYRIRIDETGRRALQACLPPQRYTLFERSCAQSGAAVHTVDGQLQELAGKWVDSWRDGSKNHIALDHKADRQTMRQVLLDGLKKEVHFGKQFLHYEEGADGKVLAHFVNGGSVVADILVAADGIHSAVAAQRFPHLQTIDSGDVCIYGKTALSQKVRATLAPQLHSGTTVVFEAGVAAVIDAMLFDEQAGGPALPPADDYIYWALVGARARFGLPAAGDLRLSAPALSATIDAVTADWAPALKALYNLADPGMRTLVPIRTAPIPCSWPASRVTVLGDAIHAMSPAGGLGANTALNDAAMLMRVLLEARDEAQQLSAAGRAGGDLLTPAIDLYETLMCARSFAAVESSLQGNRQLLSRADSTAAA